jgi:hypothetical protein
MVTRQVELTEEQNEELEQIAASKGRSVADLIRTGVDIVLRTGDSVLLIESKPRLSERESELLLAINQGLPPKISERYRTLMNRRRAETLTPEEHQELLSLTEEAERVQAERIEHLAELAQLRGKMMGELGIWPSSSADGHERE